MNLSDREADIGISLICEDESFLSGVGILTERCASPLFSEV